MRRTRVPATDVLPWKSHRANPYLYSDAEIAALIDAHSHAAISVGVWPTYQTLIGLLVVTGMRVGEAIVLDVDDFDADRGVAADGRQTRPRGDRGGQDDLRPL